MNPDHSRKEGALRAKMSHSNITSANFIPADEVSDDSASGPNTESTSSITPIFNPFTKLKIPDYKRNKQIFAIGGGKGGVGKSLVASSLAIALAQLKHKTIVIDLDLGGANLHTSLGIQGPPETLSNFFKKSSVQLKDCVTRTGIDDLEIISGANDSLAIANLRDEEKVRFLEQVHELDADFVVFDLGAGTHLNTIDFFLFSDISLLVVIPEPTSIENAYRFIKAAYFRKLLISPRLAEANEIILQASDPSNPLGIQSPSTLFEYLREQSAELALNFKTELAKFKPKLIMNQTRVQADIDIGFSIKSICRKYFGIEIDYLGHLDYDSSVWQSVRKKKPLMLEFPNSFIVSSLNRVAQYLIKRNGHIRNDLY